MVIVIPSSTRYISGTHFHLYTVAQAQSSLVFIEFHA